VKKQRLPEADGAGWLALTNDLAGNTEEPTVKQLRGLMRAPRSYEIR
jgi:hypothetical protein